MEPALQRRVQRYGWDRAAADYERLWHAQIACAQSRLLASASPAPGERVLDVACGTGLVAFGAAKEVGPRGSVVGVDLSEAMVESARHRAVADGVANVRFERMSADRLELADASFDVALCALGLMYVPEPAQALREMRRVLRPGGRMAAAVWGERSRCGWSPVFSIVDDEVRSAVCPLFFHLGTQHNLARLCAETGFTPVAEHRIDATLDYASGDDACNAAFVGGPVALAWSRFGAAAKLRARARYLAAIDRWRNGNGYAIPGEFVVVTAVVPQTA